jgi:hypothetical protein
MVQAVSIRDEYLLLVSVFRKNEHVYTLAVAVCFLQIKVFFQSLCMRTTKSRLLDEAVLIRTFHIFSALITLAARVVSYTFNHYMATTLE